MGAGRLICVVEARPPDGPDLGGLLGSVAQFAPSIDAVQLTDMPFATPHVANLAAGAALAAAGHEVILNVTCRDRNLIAQQGQLLGAAALGIRNVFCVRGDRPEAGDHPEAHGVFEQSGLQLIALAKHLRRSGTYVSGRAFSPAPALFVGAAIALHAQYGGGPDAMCAQKVDAGADFLVTQPQFESRSFGEFMARTTEVRRDCAVIAGVGPITSLEAAEMLARSSETHLPHELVDALRAAPASRRVDEGLRHALHVVDHALDHGARGVLVYPFDCTVESIRDFVAEIRLRLNARSAPS